MPRIATYGSLKKGFHNHGWLGKSKFIGKDQITGIMQIPSSYPYLFHKSDITTTEQETKHNIEIYDISQEAYEFISSAEKSSGYKEETIDTKYGKAIIWFTEAEYFSIKRPISAAYTLKVYTH